MDNWRDEAVNFNQEITRTRSNTYRKPPLGGNSNWQQSVPSWEKKFCVLVGSVPWKKLLETKKFIHLYDNIVKWNDSAAKEAFENAKYNFYANIYNLPCDNWLPDPDIYIDKINWDSEEIGQNLILDLESDSIVPDSNSKDEQVVIFGSSFPPSYQSFSPYGWGDSDDDKKKDPNTCKKNNMHEGNEGGVVDNNDKWWGWNENNETGNGVPGNGVQGYGDSRNDYWGWNVYDNNNYFYGDVNNEKKEGSGRYKTSRIRKDDNNQGSRARRNNGNRRKSSYNCVPVNSSSHRWSVKKPVS